MTESETTSTASNSNQGQNKTTSLTFRANGKLLLTSEYLVLDGALALALPTRYGQTLTVSPTETVELNQTNSQLETTSQSDTNSQSETNSPKLHWIAQNPDSSIWLEAAFKLPGLELLHIQQGSVEEAERLQKLLRLCQKSNPEFLVNGSFKASTQLEFERDWGLGSSSTLVHLLSQWSKTDAYELQQAVFGGSGYDIACADADGPILYKLVNSKPVKQEAEFKPSFSDQLYFVHLGQKQDSREGIADFEKVKRSPQAKAYLNTMIHLTIAISQADNLNDFEQHLRKHEEVIAAYMGMQPVKQRLFRDFWGAVKSLGAWGGDFVLISSNKSREETESYFQEKGFTTFIEWDKMILHADINSI